MDENLTRIRQGIIGMVKSGGEKNSRMRFCTVLSVDPDTATCSVDYEGLRIDGVTLRAVDDGSIDGDERGEFSVDLQFLKS